MHGWSVPFHLNFDYETAYAEVPHKKGILRFAPPELQQVLLILLILRLLLLILLILLILRLILLMLILRLILLILLILRLILQLILLVTPDVTEYLNFT